MTAPARISPADALRQAGEALIAAARALEAADRDDRDDDDVGGVTLAELEAAEAGPRIPDEAVGAMLDGVHPVKAMREARGLTQKQLAERVQSAPNYISQIENGRPAGRAMLRRLARALDTSVGVLSPED